MPDAARLWLVDDKQRDTKVATCEAQLRGRGTDTLVGRSKTSYKIPAEAVPDLCWAGFKPRADLLKGDYELVFVLKEGERALRENSCPVSAFE